MQADKNYFMNHTIQLAEKNAQSGKGGPFAAIVVKDDKIIAEGTNIVTSSNDPTAHAEVTAIRNACNELNSFQLKGCELYASCEPCPMCLGAIYWARLDKIYFAASREDASAAGFDDSKIYSEIPLPPDKRVLRAEQVLPQEGKKPFSIWNTKNDKIEY